jgi:hypothetical protein
MASSPLATLPASAFGLHQVMQPSRALTAKNRTVSFRHLITPIAAVG